LSSPRVTAAYVLTTGAPVASLAAVRAPAFKHVKTNIEIASGKITAGEASSNGASTRWKLVPWKSDRFGRAAALTATTRTRTCIGSIRSLLCAARGRKNNTPGLCAHPVLTEPK
jgi:hypothetical protein